MLIALLAYLAGVLTILSPCILPVLPFVFARAGQPFVTSTLPMLAGMGLTFAGVATLAAVGGAWAVHANEWGRIAAMIILAGLGLLLLLPSLADRLTRPIVALGGRLAGQSKGGIGGSFVLGAATGLLWAPCAGPVLGLILTGAALNGANLGTTLLLAAYAAGAATSLALAIGLGGRVFQAMKSSLGTGEWIRRVAGVAVLASVAAIALGFDTGVLTRLSLSSTNRVEQALIDRIAPDASPTAMMGGEGAMMASDQNSMMMAPQSPAMMMESNSPSMTMEPNPSAMMMEPNPSAMMMESNPSAMMMAGSNQGGAASQPALPVEAINPTLEGAVQWLNSPPLTMQELRGKVVLVDFWTYSCINCLRTIPYVKAWAEKYRDQGLVVIGVHSPEFAFEKRVSNVENAIADLGITYPVAIDNDYAIWRAFENRYWPAHYFIDAQGRVRYHHFGEGNYDQSERVIQQLLAEAGQTQVSDSIVSVAASGASAASDLTSVQSPETYIGYLRAQNFISPGGQVMDKPHAYTPAEPRRNEWGLSGTWTVGPENATLGAADGAIYFRFRSRDLHLVLGPGNAEGPIRFRITVDGKAPAESHGMDVDAEGYGTVTEDRLYQLVRQQGPVADHTFEIQFLDPGVEAYAFTFG